MEWVFSKVSNWFHNPNLFSSEPKFQLHISYGEYVQISDWVLKKDNIETGGELFGLWIDRSKCVVQFVIGPGQNCARSNVCFYQDTEYLRRCGEYLTQNHGLCNVGQWHSHHRLNLKEPSDGDRRTVWTNMPVLHLSAYIVCIATIDDGKDGKPMVDLNCFLFEYDNITGEKRPVQEGEFKILQGNSPMRLNQSIYKEIMKGAESVNPFSTSRAELACLEKQNVAITIEDSRDHDQWNEPVRPSEGGFEDCAAWIERPQIPNSSLSKRNSKTEKLFAVHEDDENQILATSARENPVSQINDVTDGQSKRATDIDESRNSSVVSTTTNVTNDEPERRINIAANNVTKPGCSQKSNKNSMKNGKPKLLDMANDFKTKCNSSQNSDTNSTKNDTVVLRATNIANDSDPQRDNSLNCGNSTFYNSQNNGNISENNEAGNVEAGCSDIAACGNSTFYNSRNNGNISENNEAGNVEAGCSGYIAACGNSTFYNSRNNGKSSKKAVDSKSECFTDISNGGNPQTDRFDSENSTKHDVADQNKNPDFFNGTSGIFQNGSPGSKNNAVMVNANDVVENAKSNEKEQNRLKVTITTKDIECVQTVASTIATPVIPNLSKSADEECQTEAVAFTTENIKCVKTVAFAIETACIRNVSKTADKECQTEAVAFTTEYIKCNKTVSPTIETPIGQKVNKRAKPFVRTTIVTCKGEADSNAEGKGIVRERQVVTCDPLKDNCLDHDNKLETREETEV